MDPITQPTQPKPAALPSPWRRIRLARVAELTNSGRWGWSRLERPDGRVRLVLNIPSGRRGMEIVQWEVRLQRGFWIRPWQHPETQSE
jgi:hypothetical protein